MQAAPLKDLKKELQTRPPKELLELCLRVVKSKKENKELLTYLLFEADDEQGYVNAIKRDIDEGFENINTKSVYFIKKGVRKILSTTKKFIRYSKNKETEIILVLYFCEQLKAYTFFNRYGRNKPLIEQNLSMGNVYVRQIEMMKKKIEKLPDDLQYDYNLKIESLI